MPAEADIVWSLKKHLQLHGLGPQRWPVSDIAVDSDGSYRSSPHAADLEPMMSMPIREFHPDLVCAYSSSAEDGLAAFEAKARFEDWLKGLTQARAYREGVHRAYLALPADTGSRASALEQDAGERGVGVWLLRDAGWEEVVPPAEPRPALAECRNLTAALRGVVLPRRLQLNHPINYLAAAWARYTVPDVPIQQALRDSWETLRTAGSRQHAINGARYLGLLTQDGKLTALGLTVCDLMTSLHFKKSSAVSRKRRFSDESPGLGAVIRLVFMQQESTKLIVEALQQVDNTPLSTEQLLRRAAKINEPLASGLFLGDPRDLEKASIPASAFSPSFVFQFKQSLFHAGILATSSHTSAGKGADHYQSQDDFWQLENRLFTSVPPKPA